MTLFFTCDIDENYLLAYTDIDIYICLAQHRSLTVVMPSVLPSFRPDLLLLDGK